MYSTSKFNFLQIFFPISNQFWVPIGKQLYPGDPESYVKNSLYSIFKTLVLKNKKPLATSANILQTLGYL